MFIVERLISSIAPFDCLVCGDEGALICRWCLPDAFEPVLSRCYKCYRETKDSLVCDRCRKNIKLKHVWVATEYSGVVKELIRKFKFERAQAAALLLAESLQRTPPFLTDIVFVPIPTASSRRRARGYDHTKLVSNHLAELTGMKSVSALSRLGQSRQVGSKRAKRQAQMKNAFRVVNTGLINKRHVLLVDDIVTTGATLEEAAQVLKQAGAKTVDAVVFAQSQ